MALCRQYYVDDIRKLDSIVDEKIKSFKKTLGYAPTMLSADQELLNHLHVRRDIQVVAEKVQERNFRLYEVVRVRTPRVLKVERIPYHE